MSPLEKLKLNNQLKQAILRRDAEKSPLKKLAVLKEIKALRSQLGMFNKQEATEPTQSNTQEPQKELVFSTVTEAGNKVELFNESHSLKMYVNGNKFPSSSPEILYLEDLKKQYKHRNMYEKFKDDKYPAFYNGGERIVPLTQDLLDLYLEKDKENNAYMETVRANTISVYLSSRGWGDYSPLEWVGDIHTSKEQFLKEARHLLNTERDVDRTNQTDDELLAAFEEAIAKRGIKIDNRHVDSEQSQELEAKAEPDYDNEPEQSVAAEEVKNIIQNSIQTERFNYNEEGVTARTRQKRNDQAIEIVKQLQSGQLSFDDITDEQKQILSLYSGSGGGLVSADGKKGSAYEFYTPKPIAGGMWDLLKSYGFDGGVVLDPCSGTGIFSATAPNGTLIQSVELDAVSGTINKALFQSETNKVAIQPFEEYATNTADESVDAVIANVPFGDNRGNYKFLDERYQDEGLDGYFILRSLDKLRPGRVAVFMSSSAVISSKSKENLRKRIALKAEMIGAYRMPNKLFTTAGADVVTDIIVLRKHSKVNKDIIEDVYKTSPELLTQANVFREAFISGKYFETEGKKYILGKTTQVKSRYGEQVLKVISDDSIANIAKLLQRFGDDSAINWALLDATETTVDNYQEGDMIYFGGEQRVFKNGQFVTVENNGNVGKPLEDLASRAEEFQTTPINVFEHNEKGIPTLFDLLIEAKERHYILGTILPKWVIDLFNKAEKYSFKHNEFWLGIMVAAYLQVREEKTTSNINAEQIYPNLSASIKTLVTGKKVTPPLWFDAELKQALQSMLSIVYNKKSGFTEYWKGEVAETIEKTLSSIQIYEKEIYTSGGRAARGINIDRFKELFPDVDLENTSDWVYSLDGKNIISIDDHFVGSVYDLKQEYAEALKDADDELKKKLVRQLRLIDERVDKVDIFKMNFTLTSSYINANEKLNFLNQYVANDKGRFFLEQKEDGEYKYAFKPSTSTDKSIDVVVLKRIAFYLNNNGSISSGISSDTKEGKDRHEEIITALQQKINTITAQFDSTVKRNKTLLRTLDDKLNNDRILQFKSVENDAHLNVEGINPNFSPRPHQSAFVRQQARKMGGICGFDVGLGKAQPLTAKILTPIGWVTMGDLKVGDSVISVDGKPTKVLGIFPQGEKEIFEVEFSDGSKTRCCDEHLWLTKTEPDRKKERYYRSKGINLTQKGSIKPLSEIRETLIYQSQKNHAIPMVTAVDFDEKNYAIAPYLLGVLIGDGNITTKNIRFTTEDEEIFNRLNDIVENGFNGELSIRKMKTHKRSTSYSISRKSMKTPYNLLYRALVDLKLSGLKSEYKFIPKCYLLGSKNQRIDLLRGLMDTDGYVSKDGITVEFSSSSLQLAEDVKELVMSLGGIAKIALKKTKCLDHYKVGMRLPPEINPFYLSRKASRVKPKTKYLPIRYITKVTPVGIEQAQCIMVEHPEHLYITDDYIVTHNTYTALMIAQHLQSINVKKKTLFVVPNTTLTNWQKEARTIYTEDVFARCLFVGLREKGGSTSLAGTKEVIKDIASVYENKHDKIYMTSEHFVSLMLKKVTIEEYLKYVDSTLNPDGIESHKQAEKNSANLGALAKIITSQMKASFLELEAMGIDSLIIDEAHIYKNGVGAKFGGRTKFLSVLNKPSARAANAMAKAWYIRKENQHNDGVLCLTATPITNSPQEIYSMLSLSSGEKFISEMVGVNGVNEFLETFCNIKPSLQLSVDNMEKTYQTFTGFKNVNLLRRVFNNTATMKSADDIKDGKSYIPDGIEVVSNVAMSDEQRKALDKMRTTYKSARAFIKREFLSEENLQLIYQETYDQGVAFELLAHPFNFVNRISQYLLDPNLAEQQSVFYVKNEDDIQSVKDAIDKFNALNKIEERGNKINLNSDDIIRVNNDDESLNKVYEYRVRARLDGNKIILNSTSYTMQTALLNQLQDIPLKVAISAKMAALVDNVRSERANPKAKGGLCKQIIFADALGVHNSLKILLTEECGIPANKIKIINAQAVSDQGEMQDIQDGFNADGEDNKYEIIIANKKAEVGINLQKGTQAIHHLTVGWTPDSLQQRNGRGVRQGNYLDKVTIYQYDVNGTFDNYKRKIVNSKSDWISNLVTGNSSTVDIESGFSNEEIEILASISNEEEARLAESQIEYRKQQAFINIRKNELRNIVDIMRTLNQDAESFDTIDKYIDYRAEKIYRFIELIEDNFNKPYRDLRRKLGEASTDKEKQVTQKRIDKLTNSAKLYLDQLKEELIPLNGLSTIIDGGNDLEEIEVLRQLGLLRKYHIGDRLHNEANLPLITQQYEEDKAMLDDNITAQAEQIGVISNTVNLDQMLMQRLVQVNKNTKIDNNMWIKSNKDIVKVTFNNGVVVYGYWEGSDYASWVYSLENKGEFKIGQQIVTYRSDEIVEPESVEVSYFGQSYEDKCQFLFKEIANIELARLENNEQALYSNDSRFKFSEEVNKYLADNTKTVTFSSLFKNYFRKMSIHNKTYFFYNSKFDEAEDFLKEAFTTPKAKQRFEEGLREINATYNESDNSYTVPITFDFNSSTEQLGDMDIIPTLINIYDNQFTEEVIKFLEKAPDTIFFTSKFYETAINYDDFLNDHEFDFKKEGVMEDIYRELAQYWFDLGIVSSVDVGTKLVNVTKDKPKVGMIKLFSVFDKVAEAIKKANYTGPRFVYLSGNQTYDYSQEEKIRDLAKSFARSKGIDSDKVLGFLKDKNGGGPWDGNFFAQIPTEIKQYIATKGKSWVMIPEFAEYLKQHSNASEYDIYFNDVE